MSIYPTFAEALRTVMSAHQWSSETLADVVGYKSKTSVVRILQEKSSQLNRQQFFNRLMDAQALRPDEIELLRNALNTSMIGKDQACARGIIYDIIRGHTLQDQSISPNIERALELLDSCAAADITMVNCMWPQIADKLGALLNSHPEHQLHHMFTLQDNGTSAATALACTARLAYLPNYQGHALDQTDAEASILTGANMLCATATTAQGQQVDLLVVINGVSNAHLHTAPTPQGLYSFWRATLTEAAQGFHPITYKCDTASGPASFVGILRVMRDCEKRRATYQITPDFCVNMLPAHCLRASLTEGPMRAAFSQVDESTLDRLINEFVACQRQRYDYMFNSRRAKHIIFSTRAVRHFAATGMITSHFQAMRPFTPRERLEVLRNLHYHALNDPYFNVYFFKDDFCPAYEIACWEQNGMACLPVNRPNALMSNYCCNIIRHPKLIKAFIGYFKDELRQNFTLPQAQAIEFLKSTIDRLECGQFN